MKPLLEMMPRSVVVVATHPLAGIVAQQCELTTINMVQMRQGRIPKPVKTYPRRRH